MTTPTSPDGTDPGNGYGYPDVVNWSEIERFLISIGVQPIDPGTLAGMSITPTGITFTRFRVRDDGTGRRFKYMTGFDEPAMQTTTCRIDWSA